MTKLNRPVRREVNNKYVLMLVPPERDESAIIRIKIKGKRKWYETTVEGVFWQAVKKEAERLTAERKLRRKGVRT